MTATDERSLLLRILAEMAADGRVIDEVVAAARAHSPEVARLPATETRRHVRAMVEAGMASFGLGERVEDFTAATRLGADRAAQGVPMTALLSGVQAGRRRVIEIARERCRTAGVSDRTMLEALLEFDDYVDAMERHVIGGYHTAQLELTHTARDIRTQLLRRLLLSAERVPDDELREAGLPPGRYHCLLSNVSRPVQARALEQRLSHTEGIFGLVEGRLTGVAPRLPSDPTELIVAAPSVPLDELPEMHKLCTQALNAATHRGLTGLRRLTDLAGEIALAAQPVLGPLLQSTLLDALDQDDDFHRQLALTALTYLDQGQRLNDTATALHAHPNTIRYRLARLHQLTGEPFDDLTVLDTLHWWWALRTWLD